MLKKITLLINISLTLVIFSTEANALSRNWDLSMYEDKSPRALLNISWNTTSYAEKKYLRSYLAYKHPSKMEGLFSQAWVANVNGEKDKSTSLYKKCIKKYPSSGYCVSNGSSYVDTVETFKNVLSGNAEGFIKNEIYSRYYLYLKNDKKQPRKAEEMLAAYEAKTPESYVFDYIRGISERSEQNHEQAKKYFQQSMLKEDAGLDVYKELLSLRVKYFAKGKEKAKVINEMTKGFIDKNASNPKVLAEALLHRAIEFQKLYGEVSAIFNLYKEVWDLSPSLNILKNMNARKYISYDASAVKKYLSEGEGKFSHLPEYWELMESYYWNTGGFENSVFAIKKAIKKSNIEFGEINALNVLASNYKEMFQYGKAQAAINEAKQKYPVKFNWKWQEYELNRLTGNYKKSLSSLIKNSKNNKDNAFKLKRNELLSLMSSRKKLNDFYSKNTFLKYWEKTFGQSLKVQIEFSTGSSSIHKKYYSKLKKMANVLQRKDAENYVFIIEGHTDNVGDFKLNESLSLKRANSIKLHLVKRYGVDSNKLKTKGMGEKYPISNNLSASGKKKNRRIELLPFGNLTNPKIQVSSHLPSGQFILSPDGYTVLVGDGKLWDLKSNRLIRQLNSHWGTFSPNGRFIASVSSFSSKLVSEHLLSLVITDVKTGLDIIEQPLPFSREANNISWSPAGDKVAVASSNLLDVYDINKKKFISSASVSVVPNYSSEIIWSKDGKYIFSALKAENVLRVFNAHDLSLFKVVPGVDWVHAMALSPDGNTLIAVDNVHNLTVFDTATWKYKQIKGGVSGNGIIFHPVRPLILVRAFSSDKATLINYKTLERLKSWSTKGGGVNSYSYSLDGKVLYEVGKNGKMYSGDTHDLIGQFKIKTNPFGSMTLINNNKQILSAEKESIHIWDIKDGKKIHSWNKKLSIKTNISNGEIYGLDEGNNKLYKINTNSYSLDLIKSFKFHIKKWMVKGDFLLISSGHKIDQDVELPAKGKLHVYNLITLKKVWSKNINYVRGVLKYSQLYGGRIFHWDASDKYIAFNTLWHDGRNTGEGASNSKEVDVYEIKTGKKVRTIQTDSKWIRHIAIKKNELSVWSNNSAKVYSLNTYKYLRRSTSNHHLINNIYSSENLKITSDDDRWINVKRKNEEPFLIGFNIGVSSAVVAKKRNLLIVQLVTGEMEYYDLTTFKKQLTIVPRENNEWFAYTREGYFDSSIGGKDKIVWSFGDMVLPFEALEDKYYRPKLIREKLDAIAKNDTQALEVIAQQTPVIEADFFSPPYKLTINDKTDIKTNKAVYPLKVSLATLKKGAKNANIEVVLNGRRLKNSRGLIRKKAASSGCKGKVQKCDSNVLSLPLDPGRNIVQLGVRYRGALVDSQSIIISMNKPKAKMNAQHLWYFGIGVSEYKQKENSLDYAHRDAQALSDMLKKQEGKLFKKVHTKVLTDKDVTEKSIKIAMNRFLKKASANDTIIIFTAGHGVRDNDGVLYFMTHDSNLDEPYTGMGVSFFKDFLQRRPSSQKALFWMDICHAGSISSDWGKSRGRLSSDDAVKLLADGTGIAVMASSTGMESSLEGEMYNGGHGAYTAAILEALSGKADKEAGNNDGAVTVLELQNYVSRRVPEMTGGKQHPMTPTQVRLRDYPLSHGF